MSEYKRHKNTDRGNNEPLYDSNTTYLSFDKFLTLYNADPENWHIYDKYVTHLFGFLIPYYTKGRNNNQYIKFLTKKDYCKFKKFVKQIRTEGTDTENVKEILELGEIIGERSKRKIEEERLKLEEQYEDYLEEHRKATEKCLSSSTPTLELPQDIKTLYTQAEVLPVKPIENNFGIMIENWNDLSHFSKDALPPGTIIYHKQLNKTYYIEENRTLTEVYG